MSPRVKIIVPNSPVLDWDFPEDIDVVTISENSDVPPEHRDAQACILWGMKPTTRDFVAQLPHVTWFQTLAAGPDGLLACDLADDVVVTNGVHFHDRTVAEHALMLALALVRELPATLDDQREHRWSNRGRPQPLHNPDRLTTLLDAKVVVWGFGAIGQQVARFFAPFAREVVGVARSSGERAGFRVVATESLCDELADAGVLVMVLPAHESTRHALNADVLAALPSRAIVVNVGRGSTVDEGALVDALESGRLAGAALDVVEDEPLPAESSLWEVSNLIITPHNAGGRPDGAIERVAHNCAAWRRGDLDDMIGIVRQPKSRRSL